MLTMKKRYKLRVILGENDARKLRDIGLLTGIVPESNKISGFNIKMLNLENELINLSVTSEIHDKATIKDVYFDIHNIDDTTTCQPPTVQASPHSFSVSSIEMDNTEPASSSSSSSTRLSVWPSVFMVPKFNYEAELQLAKANTECSVSGTHLSPSPKLESHILEQLAEEIIKFKAYPTDSNLNEVAEALVRKHPCLKEQ